MLITVGGCVVMRTSVWKTNMASSQLLGMTTGEGRDAPRRGSCGHSDGRAVCHWRGQEVIIISLKVSDLHLPSQLATTAAAPVSIASQPQVACTYANADDVTIVEGCYH